MNPFHRKVEIDEATKKKLFEEFKALLVEQMFDLTLAGGHPNANRFNENLRNVPGVSWNVKALGVDLAARYYGDVAASRKAQLFDPFRISWRPTRFEDYLQDWFIRTCEDLRIAPVLHRKLWEETYIINTIRSLGKLAPGMRGVVFGVGEERLPSLFAAKGADILATDLAPDSDSARSWIETRQHGALDRIFFEHLVTRDRFNAAVSFRHIDMNDIPGDLDGQFDFCWSTCAFEHLGSIANGLEFVERTGRLLKPGGVAVHTTEFNYTSDGETIDNWPTVLFRQSDFDLLAKRLRSAGYLVPEVEFSVGSTPVDFFVDVPPYHWDRGGGYYQRELDALHLKLMVDGFPATCYGVVFQKA